MQTPHRKNEPSRTFLLRDNSANHGVTVPSHMVCILCYIKTHLIKVVICKSGWQVFVQELYLPVMRNLIEPKHLKDCSLNLEHILSTNVTLHNIFLNNTFFLIRLELSAYHFKADKENQDKNRLDLLHIYCRKASDAESLIEALWLSHGALDVECSDILPVLLQQRHQEIHCQVDVVDQLILGHLDMTNGNSQTQNL